MKTNSTMLINKAKIVAASVLFIGATLVPMVTFASTNVTIIGAPSTIAAGERFAVTVSINAGAEKTAISKIVLSYPSDLIEYTGFTNAPTWFPLTQSEFDMVDIQSGTIMKTAGYPSGFANSNKLFGTLSFRAKKSGVAIIKVSPATFIYDENNNNLFKGPFTSVQTIINASTPVSAVSTPVVTTPVSTTITSPTVTPITTSPSVTPVSTDGQVAAVSVTSSPTRTYMLALLLVLILIGGAAYSLRKSK